MHGHRNNKLVPWSSCFYQFTYLHQEIKKDRGLTSSLSVPKRELNHLNKDILMQGQE